MRGWRKSLCHSTSLSQNKKGDATQGCTASRQSCGLGFFQSIITNHGATRSSPFVCATESPPFANQTQSLELSRNRCETASTQFKSNIQKRRRTPLLQQGHISANNVSRLHLLLFHDIPPCFGTRRIARDGIRRCNLKGLHDINSNGIFHPSQQPKLR